MKRWHFVIDVARCEDCNNCLLACKDEHVDNEWPGYARPQPKHGHRWIRIDRRERGQFPHVDVAYRPTPCMHCADAPCVEAGGGAITRRPDGIVLIDPVKAAGRHDLVGSCPYGSIYWNDALGVAQKCTFCAHLLDAGWKAPRCVQSCPTGALRAVLAEDAEFEREATGGALERLAPEHGTSPGAAYRHLARFDRCFIAGSVATDRSGTVDCVEGARVVLLRGGAVVADTTTTPFGDFKFDGLEHGSGPYVVEAQVEHGTTSARAGVELGESVNLGVLYV